MDIFSSSQGLIFTGHDRGMSAEEYLDLVEAQVDRLGVEDPVKVDRQRILIFRTGLRRGAKDWFGTQGKEDRRNWSKIKEAFEKRFQDPDGVAENTKAVREALLFTRSNGETISTFLQRASKIQRRLPEAHQEAFTQRVFITIPDGEKDILLQQRVSDRLFYKKQLDDHGVPHNCTFSDLKTTIELCADPVRRQLDSEDESDVEEENPFFKLIKRFEQRDDRNAELMREAMHNLSMQQTRQQGNPARQQWTPAQTGNKPARNTDTLRCFNCYKWGHIGPECPEPRNPAAWAKNKADWEEHKSEHLRKRREELKSKPAATNYISPPLLMTRELEETDQQTMGDSISNITSSPSASSIPVRYRQPGNMGTLSCYDKTSSENYHGSISGCNALVQDVEDEAYMAKRTRDESNHDHHEENDTRPSKEARQSTGREDEETLQRYAREAMRLAKERQDAGGRPSREGPGGDRGTEAAKGKQRQGDGRASPRNAENYREQNQSESKTGRRPRTLLPIKGTTEYDVRPFSIGETLRDTTVSMTMLQLLQISPTARAEAAFLMQVDPYKSGKAKKKTTLDPTARVFDLEDSRHQVSLIMDVNAMNERKPRNDGKVFFKDIAYGPDDGVPSSLGFIDGIIENVRISSILLDPGSTVDVVNLTFVEKHRIPRVRLQEPMSIRMADNQVTLVHEYGMMRLVVGDILTVIQAIIIGRSDEWDLLLGKQWHRRVGAVVDHKGETLALQGRKGLKTTIPIKPSPNLMEFWRHHEHRHWPGGKVYADDMSETGDDEDIMEDLERLLEEAHAEVTKSHSHSGNE